MSRSAAFLANYSRRLGLTLCLAIWPAANACTNAKPAMPTTGRKPAESNIPVGVTPAGTAKPDAQAAASASTNTETPATQTAAANGTVTNEPATGVTPPAVEPPAAVVASRPPTGVTPPPTGVTPPPTGVTPPPTGVIPPPAGVIPPLNPPPGVTPPATNPPPGVIPPANQPPGVMPSGFQFPAACLSNQENSYHVTDRGYIMKLTDQKGQVLAAAPMGMSAITRGFPCSAESFASCYVMDIPLSFTAAKLPVGTTAGHLSLCRAKDQSAKPEQAVCEDLAQNLDPFEKELRRTWQYIDLAVTFTVDENNAIKVTDYAGMPGDPNGENILLVYHPAFAFAAPGACNKDFVSPLVLDLDGDGELALTSAWNDKVDIRFDWRATGTKVRSGWVSPRDAFLVLGTDVRDGRDLFGEYSRKADAPQAAGKTFGNGFDALGQYDANHDGKIDAQDAVFLNLRVWRDLNGDGVAQSNELQSLPQASVAAIELKASKVPAGPESRVKGNELWYRAAYIRSDGSRHLVGDVWFNQRQGVEIVRSTK